MENELIPTRADKGSFQVLRAFDISVLLAVFPKAHRSIPRKRRDEREVWVPRDIASVAAVPRQASYLRGRRAVFFGRGGGDN